MPSARRLLGGTPAWLVWGLVTLAGLAVRVAMLSFEGTADMSSYSAWGRDVAAHGLAAGYHGIYFPLQYEIFRVVVEAVRPRH